MSEPIRPFSNGSEYTSWLQRNCYRCPKQNACDLEYALSSACVLDGTITPQIASRLGYSDAVRATLGWPCREKATSLLRDPDSAYVQPSLPDFEPLLQPAEKTYR